MLARIAEADAALAAGARDCCELIEPASLAAALEQLERDGGISIVLTAIAGEDLELLVRARQLRPDVRRVLIRGADPIDALVDACNRARPHQIVAAGDDALAAVFRDLAAEHERLRARRGRARDASDTWAALAHRDPLTGLYNHRSFQERLREELARARRYGQPLSIVFGDIDGFGALNEASGFRLGDEVLQQIASILDSQTGSRVRACDVASRFGGQEFAILLPETDKAGAEIEAERLREAVALTPLQGDLKVTISFGVAGFPDDGNEADDLLRCSLASLRRAKERGRNRVHVYTKGDEPERERDLLAARGEQFPTFHACLGELVHLLERDGTLACLYIDLSRLRRIEREFGIAQHNQLFARAGELLDAMRGERLRRGDILCRTEDADGYLCFASPPRDGEARRELADMGERITTVLESGLTDAMRGLTRDLPQVAIGMSRVLDNPMVRGSRLILRLVSEAKKVASLEWERTAQHNKALLQEIILGRRLRSVFQPIVDLDSAEIFGYEGLTRGPQGSALATPTALFSVADAVDLTLELDRACFHSALTEAGACQPVHRLFLNLLPQSFYDASFVEAEVVSLLDAAELTPANLVFEITERLAIENFSAFRQALSRYTDMGFGVAIDDVGTRHSNLESVMALRPNFIKLSEILSRGVATSTVKREMVRSLQRIAETIDAVTVAEGIETPDDLSVLRELGVRFGQGFYLSRPSAGFPEVSEEAREAMAAMPPRPRNGGARTRQTAPTHPPANGSPRAPSSDAHEDDAPALDALRDDSGDSAFEDEPTRTRGQTPVN